MAQAFPANWQPPQAIACCALKRAENPHRTGIVALWRVKYILPVHTHDCWRGKDQFRGIWNRAGGWFVKITVETEHAEHLY
jgi:hypothetical protein